MAHKGKYYPYHFRRDLNPWETYPFLWPKQFIWLADSFSANGHTDIGRNGAISDEGFERGDGKGLIWVFGFEPASPPNYTITVSFKILNNGKHMDLIIRYDDDDGNVATTIVHDAQFYLTPFNYFAIYASVAGTPPTWVNSGTANVHWLPPSGNWQFEIYAKPW